MPSNKKKFIDKKNSVTFYLAHRSQKDPLITDERAPQNVLVPIEEAGAGGGACSQPGPSSTRPNDKDSKTRKQEAQRKFGVYFDDDYDYLQHLKDSKEVSNVEWDLCERVYATEIPKPSTKPTDSLNNPEFKDTKLKLPSSVFESEYQEEIGLLNKAAPNTGLRLDLDFDVLAAMDDDFDYKDPENTLEDNFMELAGGIEMDEELVDQQKLTKEDLEGLFSSDDEMMEAEEDDSLGSLPEFSDEDGEKHETRSNFTNYSMSSSVVPRSEQLTILDDRFEKAFEGYEETEIGALDCDEIEGYLNPNSDQILKLAEEFERDCKKELDIKEKLIRLAINEEEAEENESADSEEDEPKEKWDCESILSTYSTTKNRPKVIREPSKRNTIKISQKTGMPVGVLGSGLTATKLKELDRQNESVLGVSCDTKSVMSAASSIWLPRNKSESQEERVERKTRIKEYRRERRVERKANSDAFKEEMKRQIKVRLNAKSSMLQNIILTTSASGAATFTTVPHTQISKNALPSQAVIIKSTSGKQVMAIPIQSQLGAGTSTILKAANIKSEVGIQPHATIIQRSTPILGNQMMPQIIQAGNQRLLLTRTANGGTQLIPISSPITQLGQQIVTLGNPVQTTSVNPAPIPNITANLGHALNISKQSFVSPILDHTGARKRVDFPSDVAYDTKRRKSEKGGKGLRHFSMKVCEKVRTKGITTYNEVADELVNEFASPSMGLSAIEQQFDQKNIRRRVYDALNVLMAMNIISKEKKEIKWLGLPTNSMQECTTLEKDRQKRIERLKAKTQQLHDLIIQQVAFKSLVERNKEREKLSGPPPPNGSIHLPFLIVNTSKQTVIDCSISNDKMEYLFNFDGTFEIHDDIEVLKRMGLALGLDRNDCSDEDIGKAKSLLPKALEEYIDQIGKRTNDWTAEFGDIDFEESLFHHPVDESNVFEVTGHTSLGDSLMSVEDLEMQAAIDSLHGQTADDDPDLGEGDDEEEYGEDEDDEAQAMSD